MIIRLAIVRLAGILPVVALLGLSSANAIAADPESAQPTEPPSDPARTIVHHETNHLAYALPFANLDMAQMRAFVLGNRTFNLRWATAPASATDVDGLGPTFVQHSCSACHLRDGRSRLPETSGEAITRAAIKLTPRHPEDRDTLLRLFGEDLQVQAILGVPPEATARVHWQPAARVTIGSRSVDLHRPDIVISDSLDADLSSRLWHDALVAPAVFGLGLIENIDVETLLEYQDPDDRDGDGISGRGQWLPGTSAPRLGRFGWKAGTASLREQILAAAFADMGLTSAEHPGENCPPAQAACLAAPRGDTVDLTERAVQALETYLRLLAVPAQRNTSPQFARGRAVFHALGCQRCHREQMRTGAGSPIAVLNHQTIQPYSDFLLHDLGDQLADHRQIGSATSNEWRTPPLWGLGLQTTVNGHMRLLHDGRADGVEQAILWHGGEAADSRERYRAASDQQREDLLAFLVGL